MKQIFQFNYYQMNPNNLKDSSISKGISCLEQLATKAASAEQVYEQLDAIKTEAFFVDAFGKDDELQPANPDFPSFNRAGQRSQFAKGKLAQKEKKAKIDVQPLHFQG